MFDLLMRVSIHIRHCWRMNSWKARKGYALTDVSIHIRHCWRMNSVFVESGQAGAGGFNPHSPLLANEFLALTQLVPAGLRFNPHSPLLANELLSNPTSGVRWTVSIHIRHCWRMN